MSYYVGESAGPAAAPAAASPPPAKVPASSEAPAKTESKPMMESIKEFYHKKVAGPVEVWHIGAGLGAGYIGYVVYRMMSRPRF